MGSVFALYKIKDIAKKRKKEKKREGGEWRGEDRADAGLLLGALILLTMGWSRWALEWSSDICDNGQSPRKP